MPNMRLIVTNLHDSSQVTATSEALPAEYTKRSDRSRPWRSTDTSQQVITATLPRTYFIDSLVLYRHNLSSVSQIRLELLNGSDVIYDTGGVSVSGLVPLGQFRFGIDPWGATSTAALPVKQTPFWFTLMAVTGYRVTLIDPVNADGYLEVGRIVAGQALSPKLNAAYGLQLEWQDFSEHRRTEGHSLRTVGDGLARRLPIDLNFLDADDRRKLSSELLKNGKNSDIYVSIFPEEGGLDEGEYAFLARREKNFSHTHDFYGNWKSQIVFVEV